MSTINFQDIQQNPASFLERITAGEYLVVLRDGQAVAELRPIPAHVKGTRPSGLAKGEFVVPDDFDAPLPEEILRDFEGR